MPNSSPNDQSEKIARLNNPSGVPPAGNEQMLSQLMEDWPVQNWQDVTVVVAVSGGADSVALLRMLDCVKRTPSDGRLVIAHFDHGWRNDSGEDSQFVAALAKELGWECAIGRARVGSVDSDPTPATENAARQARYKFLQSVASDCGARYLATGHTANDQAETILHRIVRGTGLQGLAGIPRFRAVNESLTVVRPILSFRRETLVDWLETIDQPFRNDSTNCDEKYTRNRIRHSLLPELRDEFNPEVDAALLRLGQLAGEVHNEVQGLVGPLLDEHCTIGSDGELEVDVEALSLKSPLILRETLRSAWRKQGWPLESMGFGEWKLLEDIVVTDSIEKKTTTLPGNVVVVRVGRRLSIRQESTS